MELEGHVMVVTGGASGIGAAVATLAAERGARVCVVDRNADHLAEVGEKLAASGAEFILRASDVADALAIAADADAVLKSWGKIDSLVTAAAIFRIGTVLDVSEEDWRQVQDVNVKGTWLWCRAVLPTMVARKSGAIVTVASQQALAGGRANAPYLASKGAVLSLTRTIALDFVAQGVRVNCVVPGAIETPMLRGSLARRANPEAVEKASLARNPMGRFGKPEEVAEAALFLAGPRSSFVTGSNLCVDGGWLAA